MPLLLFDIDGTLLTTAGQAHQMSITDAITEVFGFEAHREEISYRGKTDQQILIEVLEVHGVSEADAIARIPNLMQAMLRGFEARIEADTLVAVPGAAELLQRVAESEIPRGLVTGNLEFIAHTKLAKAGIGSHFRFGGFGSDHRDRAELARLAITRAKVHHRETDLARVFLIGDAPQDMAAGKAVGATTIGVAFHFDADHLRAHGADHVLASMQEIDEFFRMIS